MGATPGVHMDAAVAKLQKDRSGSPAARPHGESTPAPTGVYLPDLSRSENPAARQWYKSAQKLAEQGRRLLEAPATPPEGVWQEPGYGPNSSWPEGLNPVWEPERSTRRKRRKKRDGPNSRSPTPPLPEEAYLTWDECDHSTISTPHQSSPRAVQRLNRQLKLPFRPAAQKGKGKKRHVPWAGPIPAGSSPSKGGKLKRKKRRGKRPTAEQRWLTPKGIQRAADRAHLQPVQAPEPAPAPMETEETPPVMAPPPPLLVEQHLGVKEKEEPDLPGMGPDEA